MRIEERLAEVTVPVTAGPASNVIGVGTAFFVAPGLLLTCAHVVAGPDGQPAAQLRVSWRDHDIAAEVADYRPAPGPDLALLRVDLAGHAWAVLDEAFQPGDPLLAYGFPERYRAGDVATFEAEGRPVYDGSMLKVKAGQADPGMSGAPLLNVRTGAVCGILRLTRGRDSDLGARAVASGAVSRSFPDLWRVNDELRWTNDAWLDCLDDSQLAELGLRPHGRAMRELLTALRGASEALPYQLIGDGEAPPLSTIYIEQQQELQSAAQSAGSVLHTPDQALGLYPHLLVEGGPGAGKSTLANHLIADCAAAWLANHRRPYLAVPITARALAESTTSFDETLTRHIEAMLGARLSRRLPADLFQRPPARDTKWLVVIDGVDEVPSDARTEFIELLAGKVRDPSGPWQYLITTRPLRRGERQAVLGERLGHYVLRLFERPQIRAFTDVWFAARGGHPDDAQQFMRRLDQSRLLDVATVPLLLTLAALVYEQDRDEDLPTRRVDLYQRFAQTMLTGPERRQRTLALLREEFDASYGAAGQRAAEELFDLRSRLLEHLASWRQSGHQGPLPPEAVRWARQQVTFPDDMDNAFLAERVTLLLARTGLIARGPDGTLAFAHHTLREYLTARNLARSVQPDDPEAVELAGRWQLPGWREIVLFVLALWRGPDVSGHVERVLAEPGGAVFAGQALAENVEVASATREKVIQALIELAAQRLTGTSLGPLEALRTLGAIRADASALAGLTRLARAPGGDPVGRLLAAEALIRAGNREAATEALVALAADPRGSAAFVAETASRLDGMGLRPEAIDILVTIAAQPATDPRGVLQAAISLTDLGAPGAARSILSVLVAIPDQKPLIRLRAAQALERTGDAGLAATVYRSLLDPHHPPATEIRIAAAGALGQLADRSGAQDGRTEAVAVLAEVARQPASGWSGFQAVESLQLLRAEEEARAAQRDALNDETAPLWWRVQLAISLRRAVGDPQAAALIEQIANDRHVPLVTWAAAVDDLSSVRLVPVGTALPADGSPQSLVELTRRDYLGFHQFPDPVEKERACDEAARALVRSWRAAFRAGSAV